MNTNGNSPSENGTAHQDLQVNQILAEILCGAGIFKQLIAEVILEKKMPQSNEFMVYLLTQTTTTVPQNAESLAAEQKREQAKNILKIVNQEIALNFFDLVEDDGRKMQPSQILNNQRSNLTHCQNINSIPVEYFNTIQTLLIAFKNDSRLIYKYMINHGSSLKQYYMSEELIFQTINVLATELNYLIKKLPANPFEQEHVNASYPPSDWEWQSWQASLNALCNPLIILNELKEGWIREETLEVLNLNYPRIKGMMIRILLEIIALENKFDYNTSLLVGQFLDSSIDPAMSQEIMASINRIYRTMPELEKQINPTRIDLKHNKFNPQSEIERMGT